MVGAECFRGRYRSGSNEVETGKYSGFWLIGEVESLWLRVESPRKAVRLLSTLNTHLSTSSSFFPPSPSPAGNIGILPVCLADMLSAIFAAG
jgi:hypothetical protein